MIVFLKNGMPVNLTNAFGEVVLDIEQFVSSFIYETVKYRYYRHTDFRPEEKKASFGYFKESVYLGYIQGLGTPIPTADDVSRTDFDFKEYEAKPGDLAEVEVLNFEAPYDYYYKRNKYTFPIEIDPQTKGVRWYKLPGQDTISIPAGASVVSSNRNLNSTPRGLFYNNNFGTIVDGWPAETDKKRFSRTMTLTAFNIFFIEKDIFPKILDAASMNEVNEVADRPNGPGLNDLSNLSDIQKMIFILKKSWGYYYDLTKSGPHHHDFDPILPTEPIYQAFEDYQDAVLNFYRQAYVIQDKIASKPENERVRYLLEIMPQSAIRLFPYEIRIQALKDMMQQDLTKSKESYTLRIVYSFTTEEADMFLDFLLQVDDGKRSNFHVLHFKMDDARASRYPFVSWFLSEASNRKYFNYAIYKLWLTSKYYAAYIPPGTTPNADELNPTAFFIKPENEKYYTNSDSILEYSTSEWTVNIYFGASSSTYESISYSSEIQGHLLKVNKVRTMSGSAAGGNNPVPASFDTSIPFYFTTYHLYQPIALVNYTPDVEVQMPQSPLMPAFLFHYIEEFDRLKDFDAGFSLAIEVALEAVFFYFFGGITLLKDLRYYKYVTRIGKAMRNQLSPADAVAMWRGIEATSSAFTVTASILTSVSSYFATTINDPDRKLIAQKLSRVFLFLTFASAATAVYGRAKAVSAAGDVLAAIDNLPPNTPHNLPPQIIDLLMTIKDGRAVAMTLFKSEVLDQIQVVGTNRIVAKFLVFDPEEQVAFWKDFQHMPLNDARWEALNKLRIGADGTQQTLVDIWRSEIVRLTVFRNRVSFLEAFDRFKHARPHEFVHVRYLTGTAGGHSFIYVTTDINSAVIYKIVPQNASYATNIPAHLRTRVTPINGHIKYENLWKYHPNGPRQINGQTVKRKPTHYVINPAWDDQTLLEEMAYAWANKTNILQEPTVMVDVMNDGIQFPVTRTKFRSQFTDGTPIEFIFSSHQKDPVTGLLKLDHLSIMKIL